MSLTFQEYIILGMIGGLFVAAVGGREVLVMILRRFGWVGDIEKKLNHLKENDLAHIESHLEKIIEKLDKIHDQNTEMLIHIKSKI